MTMFSTNAKTVGLIDEQGRRQGQQSEYCAGMAAVYGADLITWFKWCWSGTLISPFLRINICQLRVISRRTIVKRTAIVQVNLNKKSSFSA
jgi:hypothetical protein